MVGRLSIAPRRVRLARPPAQEAPSLSPLLSESWEDARRRGAARPQRRDAEMDQVEDIVSALIQELVTELRLKRVKRCDGAPGHP